MPAIWKGTRFVRRNRKTTTERNNQSIILTYEGKYEDLIAQAPAIDSTIETEAEFAHVEKVEIEELDGGKGQMTVTMQGIAASDTPGIPDPQIQIIWVQVDKPLENHPIFQSGGIKALTDADREKIKKKLANPDDVNVPTPTGNAYELYKRLLAGISHYPVYVPEVRKTTFAFGVPTTSGCGKVETPSVSGFPSSSGNGKNYKYIKAEDEKTKTSRLWERREVWRGFEEIDNLIYDNL